MRMKCPSDFLPLWEAKNYIKQTVTNFVDNVIKFLKHMQFSFTILWDIVVSSFGTKVASHFWSRWAVLLSVSLSSNICKWYVFAVEPRYILCQNNDTFAHSPLVFFYSSVRSLILISEERWTFPKSSSLLNLDETFAEIATEQIWGVFRPTEGFISVSTQRTETTPGLLTVLLTENSRNC